MNSLKSFDEMLSLYESKGRRCKAVIVSPNDDHVEYVIKRCTDNKLVDITLVYDGGELESISEYAKLNNLKTVSCADTPSAAQEGVRLVRNHEADVLMKGSLSTDVLLHAVIDKANGNGLLAKDTVMSHVALIESPAYHKLLMASDVAVIPSPDLNQFDAMINYDCKIARTLGASQPKVALIHFTEKINPKFAICGIYETLKSNALSGKYGNALADGPMDVKTACDKESAKYKHMSSPVIGDADIVILPDLEAGNTFYKTVSFFGKSKMAGLVTGTMAPIVVGSRADTAESKFFSLIFSCLAANDNLT